MPTTIAGAMSYYEENDPRGEYVLVIEGKSFKKQDEEKQSGFAEMSIEDHMKIYEDQGIDKKEAMKLVAKDRGVSKRDIYNALL